MIHDYKRPNQLHHSGNGKRIDQTSVFPPLLSVLYVDSEFLIDDDSKSNSFCLQEREINVFDDYIYDADFIKNDLSILWIDACGLF